jgi:DNA-binding LytR/AlgR family response regulator
MTASASCAARSPDRSTPWVRIHRCHLVDLRRATRLRAEPGSRDVLVLADGTELPVGRTRVAALRDRLI